MRAKRFRTVAIALAVFLVLNTVVMALSMGDADGVWGNTTANCSAWATGPGDSPTAYSEDDPGIQTPPTTDENQVRYGRPAGVSSGCGTFGNRSGFGFEGVEDVGTLAPYTDFVLGRITHYNNPIYASDFPLDQVTLSITVDGILCEDGSVPQGGSEVTFGYVVQLDETPNSGSGAYCGNVSGVGSTYECPYTVGDDPICPYVGGINANGCADRVLIAQAPVQQTFTCGTGEDEYTFTINIAGFINNGASTDCSTQVFDPAKLTDTFTTREQTDNNACLWAQVGDYTPTAVTLAEFTATAGESSIELAWSTADEVDNVGFNLYRAESEDGERVLVNETLIPAANPGSTEGAAYSYTDTGVVPGVTYFYWLGDVDVSGVETFHGPASASLAVGAPNGDAGPVEGSEPAPEPPVLRFNAVQLPLTP